MGGPGDVVAAELSAVAAAVARRLPHLSHEIWEVLTRDIPELRGDDTVEKLLDVSVEENVATLLHLFQHRLGADDVRAPAAAVEYARRLAQRDVPTNALVRAYRVGHGRFVARCLDELAARNTDSALAAAVTSRLVQVSFRYIDRVSDEVVEVHQQERDRWLLTQTAVRAGRVRELLRGTAVDVPDTETALGYRLRRHHLGVIAWVVGPVHGSEGLLRLDRLGSAAARRLSDGARHLFIPRDESLAWLWLPAASASPLRYEELLAAFDNGDGGVRVATGAPAYGLEGFRRTHVEAERAQHLALSAEPGNRVTAFSDVGIIALMCSDVDAARSWIWGTLAELARDDEAHGRLRDTLQAFLSTGSYTATAERLALHKNTVQYRIRKAEDALGKGIEGQHADLELALRTCQYLGQAVLRPADPEAAASG
jgi:DNA-binding PucR family transcriptional regulator